ncbi:BQ5605_C011g06643 [Microbotryum silenes-dioicae]|uniref:BQ5605_C011g06643 protein n=1 Tax=Microbotryum silenes-dioicae TaxID=796604 RepID=A0A2X0LPN8_9BASI|nr:BQ5605_C011g06643 [Microbotryum silenes-dioicae]
MFQKSLKRPRKRVPSVCGRAAAYRKWLAARFGWCCAWLQASNNPSVLCWLARCFVSGICGAVLFPEDKAARQQSGLAMFRALADSGPVLAQGTWADKTDLVACVTRLLSPISPICFEPGVPLPDHPIDHRS